MSIHKLSICQFSLRSVFIFLTAALCLWAAAIEKVDVQRDREGFPRVEVKTRLRWHLTFHRFYWSIHDLDNLTERNGSCWVLRLWNQPTNCSIVYDNYDGYWREYSRRSEVPIIDWRESAKQSRALHREIRLFEGPCLIVVAVVLFCGCLYSLYLLAAWAEKNKANIAENLIGPICVYATVFSFFCAVAVVLTCLCVLASDVYGILSGA